MSFGILRPERRKIQVNFPGYRSIPRAAPQKKPVRAFFVTPWSCRPAGRGL